MRTAERRLADLTVESQRRHAAGLVEQAMRAGKVTTAQREWATAWALKDGPGFEEWASSAPVVVVLGRTEPPGRNPAHSTETLAANARRQFQVEPMLARLTSEQAWVRQAVREQSSR